MRTLLLLLLVNTALHADDWPQWMGPNRDAVWHEAGGWAMRAVLGASDALLRHEQATVATRQRKVQAQIEDTQRRLALLALACMQM